MEVFLLMIDDFELDGLFDGLSDLFTQEVPNDFVYEEESSISNAQQLAMTDVVWVKLTFQDNSINILRGSYSPLLAKEFNLTLEEGLIIDVDRKKLVDLDGCTVEYSITKFEYERRLDEFANRFI